MSIAKVSQPKELRQTNEHSPPQGHTSSTTPLEHLSESLFLQRYLGNAFVQSFVGTDTFSTIQPHEENRKHGKEVDETHKTDQEKENPSAPRTNEPTEDPIGLELDKSKEQEKTGSRALERLNEWTSFEVPIDEKLLDLHNIG